MPLIIFIHKESAEKGDILKKAMEQNFHGTEIQIFKTMAALKANLKQVSKYSDKEIFILLADSEKRLTQLIPMIDVFEGRRLILILPNNSQATTSKAHKFFPRYFTYVSNNYDDLCSVLNKMMNPKTNINT